MLVLDDLGTGKRTVAHGCVGGARYQSTRGIAAPSVVENVDLAHIGRRTGSREVLDVMLDVFLDGGGWWRVVPVLRATDEG